MAASSMPLGWDLQRIRDRSGDQAAEALDTDRPVTADPALLPTEPAPVESAFGFHDLALVRFAGSDEWHMGSLAAAGSIHLWATYRDFESALTGL